MQKAKLNLKLKLAMLWTSFMFLYIYVDYMAGKIGDIRSGIASKLNITQGFLLEAHASVTIPSIMIFLSVALPVKINRLANIIIAALYIPYTMFNLAGAGEAWMQIVFITVIQVVLLCLIILYAWKLPLVER